MEEDHGLVCLQSKEYTCPNTQYGCTFRSNREDLRLHLKNCSKWITHCYYNHHSLLGHKFDADHPSDHSLSEIHNHHYQQHYKPTATYNPPTKCRECEKECSSTLALKIHLDSECPVALFLCQTCRMPIVSRDKNTHVCIYNPNVAFDVSSVVLSKNSPIRSDLVPPGTVYRSLDEPKPVVNRKTFRSEDSNANLMTTSTPIMSLSRDVLLHLLSFLKGTDILRCTMVCKEWNKILNYQFKNMMDRGGWIVRNGTPSNEVCSVLGTNATNISRILNGLSTTSGAMPLGPSFPYRRVAHLPVK